MAVKKSSTQKAPTLPSFIDLAQQGFTILKAQSQLFFKLVLIGYLPLVLTAMALQYFVFGQLAPSFEGTGIESQAASEELFQELSGPLITTNVAMVFAGLWSLFMNTVIIYTAGLYFLDPDKLSESTPAELMGATVRKLPSLILTQIFAALGLLLLFVLLIIPAVLFSIYWIFLIQVVLFSNLSGIEALRHSFNLVKNRWWLVFRYLVGLGFVSMAVNVGVQWVSGMVMVALPTSLAFLASSLLIVSYFLMTAITISMVSLYLTLNKIGPAADSR